MPNCPNCGEPVREGDTYCNNCRWRMDYLQKDRCTRGLTEIGYLEWGRRRGLDVERECVYCGGAGKEPGGPGVPSKICRVCDGDGYNVVPEDWPQCKECNGTGKKPVHSSSTEDTGDAYEPCPFCEGIGWSPHQ